MELCVLLIMIQYIQSLYRIRINQLIILSEVSCFYSTIPIFASYNSLLSQSFSNSIIYNSSFIIIGDSEYYHIRDNGCIPSIVTDAPTVPPEENSLNSLRWLSLDSVNIMNIVAAFLLFLIILYFVVKCVLSIEEDKRTIKAMVKNQKTDAVEIELKATPSSS